MTDVGGTGMRGKERRRGGPSLQDRMMKLSCDEDREVSRKIAAGNCRLPSDAGTLSRDGSSS